MAKKRNTFVVLDRTDEVQSTFEDDIDMYVVHKSKKGVVYNVYFTEDGVTVSVNDLDSKKGDYQLVLEPCPMSGSYPSVDVSVRKLRL